MNTDYINREDVLYCITVEDIQDRALEQLGRPLTPDELSTSRKALESGLGIASDISINTIFTELV